MTSVDLSRRSLVASVAALPTLAVPAVAVAAVAEPDPVFTLIEAHRQVYQCWSDAVHVEAHMYWNDPRMPAAEAETNRCADLKWDAYDDLIAAPTTVAGVAAVLEYICEVNNDCDSEFTKEILIELMQSIAPMLRDIAVRS